MPKKKIEWMTMEPEFPKEAFTASLFVSDKGRFKMLSPLNLIYENQKQLLDEILKYRKDIKKYKYEIPGAIIYLLKLHQKINHKKEYWAKPSVEYNSCQRIKDFLDMSSKPKLYQILVVPSYYDEKFKQWQFKVAAPFYLSSDNSTIEKFMLTSKENVSMKAKYSATYIISRSFGVNLETGEIEEANLNKIKDDEVLN